MERFLRALRAHSIPCFRPSPFLNGELELRPLVPCLRAHGQALEPEIAGASSENATEGAANGEAGSAIRNANAAVRSGIASRMRQAE